MLNSGPGATPPNVSGGGAFTIGRLRCFQTVLTNTRRGVGNSLCGLLALSQLGKCYRMNTCFESCSEIPVCRGPEVLLLLIEVNPISGKESEQYPDAYPKEYRERGREILEKLYLAEDDWRDHHRIP